MEPSKTCRFYEAAPLERISEGAALEVSVNGRDILLCRYADKIYAVENRCSHQDRKLSRGRLRKGQIICPFHGARFDLASGAACSAPATAPIATFAVREVNGIVEVAVPDDAA